MKNLRITLSILAFVLAVSGAFASTIFVVVAQSRQMVSTDQGTLQGACQPITLVLSTCDTVSSKFCDLQSSDNKWWRYFDDNQCIVPFRKQ